MSRLAAAIGGHPKRTLVLCGIAVVLAAMAASTVFESLKPFGFEDPAAESIIARDTLESKSGEEPSPGLVALIKLDEPINSPASRKLVDSTAATLGDDSDLSSTLTYYQSKDPSMLATDAGSTYVLGFFKADLGDQEKQDAFVRIEKEFEGDPEVKLGGLAAAYSEIGTQVEEDLRRAELYAFPILFLLSLLIFRSMVAAGLPLLVGGISIIGALAGLRIASEFTDLSIFAVNLITGIGLGLSIDYSLFVVSRYREELARSGHGQEALRRTMVTAGRTVAFSSITVAVALASMVVFPQRFLYSMGIGGAMVALLAAVVSLTVLPALLALLGERVNSLAPKRLKAAAESSARPATSGFWYRLSHVVMRHPISIATVSTVIMLAAGAPFLRAEFTFADAGILPKDASARQVFDITQADYPPNRDRPIQIETEASNTQKAELATFTKQIEAIKGVTDTRGPIPVAPGFERLDVFYESHPFSAETTEIAEQIRKIDAPFEYRVGGSPAEFIDQNTSLIDHLPAALAIIVISTLIVLFLMTGSVILPFKALIMNFLTVSVAFGSLVLIFQDGRFESALAYTTQNALDSSNAVLIFAVVFGLSTDYGVFLLTRIKEARDAGASDSEAVAIGMERTGRIITAAALLLCIAIGSNATSEIIFIKQFAVGAGIGVLVDATIVRGLLVPSLMQLLGRWNWWAPRPLRWLHWKLGFDESDPEPEPGVA